LPLYTIAVRLPVSWRVHGRSRFPLFCFLLWWIFVVVVVVLTWFLFLLFIFPSFPWYPWNFDKTNKEKKNPIPSTHRYLICTDAHTDKKKHPSKKTKTIYIVTNFHTCVSSIDAMFTWCMEMELHQIIHLPANSNRVIMSIRSRCPVHLDRMTIEMRNNPFEGLVVKGHGFARTVDEARERVSIDIDG
jgi:hypothetical protein